MVVVEAMARPARGEGEVSSTKKIRILCVDDHPIVREGLASTIDLQADMELVGTRMIDKSRTSRNFTLDCA